VDWVFLYRSDRSFGFFYFFLPAAILFKNTKKYPKSISSCTVLLPLTALQNPTTHNSLTLKQMRGLTAFALRLFSAHGEIGI